MTLYKDQVSGIAIDREKQIRTHTRRQPNIGKEPERQIHRDIQTNIDRQTDRCLKKEAKDRQTDSVK